MNSLFRGVALLALGAAATHAANAQTVRTNVGGVDLWASGAISAQAGTFKSVDTGVEDEASEWDASLVLNAERVTAGGLVFGFRAEVDTGNREAEELQRDEIYIYVAGDFGRVELGEQDGAADTISLHAPVLGLGQIRGDFVRYTGSAALLTPFDTRDSLKITYLSAPVGGLRFGLSYAPEFASNESDPNPRRRTVQENAIEAAAAYQASFGEWVGGVSVSYVGAEADPLTERADLESWGVGGEVRRGALTLGGGYVSRGDSNSLTPGLNEEEVNAGVAWRAERWGVGLSASNTTSTQRDNRLIGVGAYYEFTDHWIVRSDIVSIEETPAVGPSRDAYVGIAEIAFVF